MVDDPIVEGVAGHSDAGLRQGRGFQPLGRAFEPDDGEVAGAAAEVGDQDGGVLFQGAGEIEGGADGFIGVADVLEP